MGVLNIDRPAAVIGQFFKPQYGGARVELDPRCGASLGQQTHIQRDLRAMVAAGGAIAATDARFQRHAGDRPGTRTGGHGNRYGALSSPAQAFQCPGLGILVYDGIGFIPGTGSQPLLNHVVVTVDRAIASQLGRPWGLLHDIRAGSQHDARIDERAPADSVGDKRHDIAAHPDIEQARSHALGRGLDAGTESHVARELGRAGGKAAAQILQPALKDADGEGTLGRIRSRRPASREHPRGNRGAIAASHDDQVEIDRLWWQSGSGARMRVRR